MKFRFSDDVVWKHQELHGGSYNNLPLWKSLDKVFIMRRLPIPVCFRRNILCLRKKYYFASEICPVTSVKFTIRYVYGKAADRCTLHGVKYKSVMIQNYCKWAYICSSWWLQVSISVLVYLFAEIGRFFGELIS